MRGSLIWAFALVMVSNILSTLTLLSFPFILTYWIVYLLFFALRLFQVKPLQIAWAKPDGYVCVLLCIALLTFIAAVLYPPTSWDSMVYHMPKVMQWWQNNSLEHYYTSILRQTGLSPFAELVIFHSFVLSGTDYLANLVQWGAFIGTMCVAAATASLLGADRTGQVLAALFLATLPMGIAQASSTQTDLVVGFWLSCAAARFIIWQNEPTANNAIYFGMAVGLAIQTKGTAYVISLPFVFAFAFLSIKQYRQLLSKAVLSGIIAMMIFMPHVYRNYTTYNSPITGSHGTILFPPTVKSFIVTILANLVSNDPLSQLKPKTDIMYEKFLTVLHINPKDTSIFPFGPISERAVFSTHEGSAQNPVHTLLLLWCLSGIGIGCHTAANRHRWHVIGAVALFCLLFAWNPWITRIQTPLFALAAPLAGIVLEKSGRRLRNTLCVFLMLYCTFVLFWNHTRPLFPDTGPGAWTLLNPPRMLNPYRRVIPSVWERSRADLYFSDRPELRKRYLNAVDILVNEGATSIGLVIGGDSWEYPLWTLLRTRMPVMPQIRHIVPPETAEGLPVTPQAFAPQYLFVLEQQLAWEKQEEITDDPLRVKELWRAWEKKPDEIKAPLRLFKRIHGVYERIF